MSVSLKMLPKMKSLTNIKDTSIINFIYRDKSIEKPKKYLSLNNLYYNQEKIMKTNTIINPNLPILNLISISSIKLASMKTALSDNSPNFFNYSLCMINKYDENLNDSLSFISEFDLEEENENESSFNSIDNDDSVEQVEITNKNKKKTSSFQEEEYNSKLEKEWEDIQYLLLNKNSS